MKLGFLGTGTIASAVIEGLSAFTSEHSITISQRNTQNSQRLAQAFPTIVVEDNQTVIDNSEVVFIGSTAEAAPQMLEPLRFRADQLLVSFMVGISAEILQSLVAPARFETLMIPFPSIVKGGSPILLHPESRLIQDLFGQNNTIISLSSEADLAEFLAAQAVLSPITKILETASLWLGEKTADAHKAEQFLRLLVGGSLMAEPLDKQKALAQLLSALNTPGGLNAQLREYMEEQGTYAQLQDGLNTLSQRLAKE